MAARGRFFLVKGLPFFVPEAGITRSQRHTRNPRCCVIDALRTRRYARLPLRCVQASLLSFLSGNAAAGARLLWSPARR